MAKGDSLKKFKIEQKDGTRKKLQKVIDDLKSSGNKVSVSNVAVLSGISRANIYANYKDLFEKTASINSKIKSEDYRNELKEKNDIIEKLRAENKQLLEANHKLMDQLVAMKILLKKKL
jgi:small-conductance mechanosensitive channel